MPKPLPFLFFLLLSCNPLAEKPNSDKVHSLFHLLLKKQEADLGENKTEVLKISTINANTDTTLLKNISWDKELALFYEIDIFKPIYKGIYKTENSKADSMQIEKYMKSMASKSSIDSLFICKTNTGKLWLINAFGSKSNFLFKAKSTYTLQFDTLSTQLKKYELNAEKTFVWGKSETYRIYSVIDN